MEYGDTIAYEYDDGEQRCTLRLTYNANTYLVYKRFFDTDLLGDILKFTSTDVKLPSDIQEKINNGELTVDNIDKANLDGVTGTTIDTAILVQIIIAMIATNERMRGIRRGAEEIASQIKPYIMYDVNFFQQVTELILFGLKKKKVGD